MKLKITAHHVVKSRAAGVAFVLLFLFAFPLAGQTLDEHIKAYHVAGNAEARTTAFYTFVEALSEGSVVLQDGQDREMAFFLTEVLLSPRSRHEKLAAGDLLLKHPHPDVADALFSYILEQQPGFQGVAGRALQILSALGDERALPLLTEGLDSAEVGKLEGRVRQLADLRHVGALPALRALLADSTLDGRLAETRMQRSRENGHPPDPENALEWGHRFGDRIRLEADLAVRQITWQAELGIDCTFDLGHQAMADLDRRGFVILPQPTNEMFEWYSEEYPFVTTDFVYHTWSILLRAACEALEETLVRDDLGAFCAGMAAACEGRDAALFGVAAVLLGAAGPQDLSLDPDLEQALRDELRLINNRAGVESSGLLNRRVDYTEFQPRGRFSNGDPALQQALEWLNMAVLHTADRDEVRRAGAVTLALYSHPELVSLWERLDRVFALMGGPQDDPAYDDYRAAAVAVAGGDGVQALAAVLEDEQMFRSFRAVIQKLPGARIKSEYGRSLDPEHGLPLLGARHTVDAAYFQELLLEGKWPLSGLDMAAGVLGSERAAHRLCDGTQANRRLPDPGDESFMAGFLQVFATVFQDGPALSPPFDTEPWQDKMLNAALGAWAETRNAVAPYAKEAHDYMGCSMMTDRVHGFVEPYPEFFRLLAERVQALHFRLEDWGVYACLAEEREQRMARRDSLAEGGQDEGKRLTSARIRDWQLRYRADLATRILDDSRLPAFQAILERLVELAQKGRDGRPQNADDGLFLKSLAGRMRRLGFHESNSPHAEQSMARVIDVAREYLSGQVLWAGPGRALPIYVAVPDGETRVVCRGAVYTYYEGVRDLDQGLDDALWQASSMTQQTLLGEPWLDSVAGLVSHPLLSRADLLELEGMTGRSGDFANPKCRWVSAGHREGTWPVWVGARCQGAALDVLVRLADNDKGSDGLRLMALRELARQGTEPAARRFFRRRLGEILARAESGKGVYGQDEQAVFHFGLLALQEHPDPEDRVLIKRLKSLLHRAPLRRGLEPMGWELLQRLHLQGPPLRNQD